jgi:hypothetical protein
MGLPNRLHDIFPFALGASNAQAKLRGLMIFRRAAASFSLLLASSEK